MKHRINPYYIIKEKTRVKTRVKTQSNRREKGSVLILTIMAVLILSIMVTGLMEVGTTEVYTTKNFQLSKTAYYTALQGIEEIRNLIIQKPDAESITSIKRSGVGILGTTMIGEDVSSGTSSTANGQSRYYITGTMMDMENYEKGDSQDSTAIKSIYQLKDFPVPPLPGMSLSANSNFASVVWNINITSSVKSGSRRAYAEIVSGVLSILTVNY